MRQRGSGRGSGVITRATSGKKAYFAAARGSDQGRYELRFLDFAAQFVALAARRLQVEHQVLHVQPQLAEGVLHQAQNPAATLGALQDPRKQGLDPLTVSLG